MDSAEFKRRSEQNELVYQGEIVYNHKSSIVNEIKSNDYFFSNVGALRSMTNSIIKQIETQEHFTIMIIKLNHDSIARILTNSGYLNIIDQLAHIYHFHLHPEHRPNKIMKLSKFDTAPLSRYIS